MINLEFERKAFNDWHLLKYGEFVNWWDDTPASWIHNDRWEGWKSCAESKQAEIDLLKAQLAKVESGEYVIVPKEPTNEIIDAGFLGLGCDHGDMEKAYLYMIKSAQEQNND